MVGKYIGLLYHIPTGAQLREEGMLHIYLCDTKLLPCLHIFTHTLAYNTWRPEANKSLSILNNWKISIGSVGNMRLSSQHFCWENEDEWSALSI